MFRQMPKPAKLPIDQEVDRLLEALRDKIREKGYTQLQVQDDLDWGRSYISQLLTRQKGLRVEQVLKILKAIKVDPAEFYGELYNFPMPGSPAEESAEEKTADEEALEKFKILPSELPAEAPEGEFLENYNQVRALVQGLAELLLDKELVTLEEISDATRAATADSKP